MNTNTAEVVLRKKILLSMRNKGKKNIGRFWSKGWKTGDRL